MDKLKPQFEGFTGKSTALRVVYNAGQTILPTASDQGIIKTEKKKDNKND
jgi:hypothetical protein